MDLGLMYSFKDWKPGYCVTVCHSVTTLIKNEIELDKERMKFFVEQRQICNRLLGLSLKLTHWN